MHVVVVGNGVAGIEAALALRRRDAGMRITLVGDEHPHFYARTALMYVLCGQLSLRDTEPYERHLYARERFTRVVGRVASVDAAAHRLLLTSRGSLAYDRLLLACGSVARPLPWPEIGAHAFVTLRDLERLDGAARPGQSVAVIGGGLIGVEVAEALLHRGLRVHFLVREPWYFPVALDANESAVVMEHIRHHDVDVRVATEVRSAARVGSRTTLDLDGGPLEVDHVVAAIGVVPNTGFLVGSGVALAENGAIEVDDALRSVSAPDVWAAGDCANVTWADGSRRPEQLWYTARDQGRAAARSLLGDAVRYRRGTWYNSAKFFDIEYTTAGWIPYPGADDGATSWFHHEPGTARTVRVVCRDGDRVVGFNCLGRRWDHGVFLRWIGERRTLAYVRDHLGEARFDGELAPPLSVGG